MDDDFASFLAEIKEAKSVQETTASLTEEKISPGKRQRGKHDVCMLFMGIMTACVGGICKEGAGANIYLGSSSLFHHHPLHTDEGDEGANGLEHATAQVATAQPVFKKAKVVVASAKPQMRTQEVSKEAVHVILD